jgi:hypothetical protein
VTASGGGELGSTEETPVWIEVPRCVVVCGELRGCGLHWGW